VLGSMSSFYSVTDFIRRHGLRWGALKVASDLAAHSKVSLWRILRASIRNGMSHSGFDMTAELLRDPTLLTESALAGVNKPRAFHPHPWFPLIDEMLPGTAQMVVGLTIRPDYYHPLTDAAESRPERLFPLLSQPFVELCLRIPSYVLNHGGRDRALARRAFVGDVPETILKRYWKDRAAGQEHVVLAANLEFFRELLLDGVLVKERLIDKGKLEEALSGRPTKSPVPIVKIFDAALVETWLRTKPGVLQRLAA